MRFAHRPRALAAVISAALSLALAACGGSSATVRNGSSTTARGNYTLGMVVARTGPASQLGVGEINGARLAVSQINSHGGINGHKLTLSVADDATNPSQTIQKVRQLSGSVAALIGPSVVADCKAAIPLVKSGPVDYCLSPGIQPQAGSWVWSSSAATATLAQRLLGYWKKQGIVKIGLIYTTDGSGEDGAHAVTTAAQASGSTIVAKSTYNPTAVDITSQVQQVMAAKPQALVVWATGTPAGVAFKDIQQAGINLPVATTDGNLSYAFLKRISGFVPKTLLIPATRDFWWQQSASSSYKKLEKTYHDAYQSKYQQKPDYGPGVAYDAVNVLADAMRHVGTDPAKIRAYLQKLHGYAGVVATYSFSNSDHRGVGLADVGIVKAQNGTFVAVSK